MREIQTLFESCEHAVPPLTAEMWGEVLMKYMGGQMPSACEVAIGEALEHARK